MSELPGSGDGWAAYARRERTRLHSARMSHAAWNAPRARGLGAALRLARKRRGISQETLAHRAGVSKKQIHLIEAGRASGHRDASGPANPRVSTLVGLAAVLGIDVSELFREAGL